MKPELNAARVPSALLLLAAMLGAGVALAAPVTRDEAAAVADYWIAREIGSPRVRLADKQRADRLATLQDRQVLCLVEPDLLLDQPPKGAAVLAYVVKYRPSGYVIVSGEDRIQPIIAFSATDEFRWDCPELNFGREYLGATLTA